MPRILARVLFIPVLVATTFAFSGTTPFVLDGNRVYARLAFVRPDGSLHRALAFVDMGSPSTILTESLFKELQLDRNRPLTFHVGTMTVRVPAAQVTSDPSPPYSAGADLKVEAILPAGVMQRPRWLPRRESQQFRTLSRATNCSALTRWKPGTPVGAPSTQRSTASLAKSVTCFCSETELS